MGLKIAVYHNLPSGGGKRALLEMMKRLAPKHVLDVYSLSSADHNFCDLRPYCHRHIVVPFNSLPLSRPPFGRLNQGIRVADLMRLHVLQRNIAARIDAEGYDITFAHACQYAQSPGVLQFLLTPSVYYCQEPPRLVYEPRLPRSYVGLNKLQKLGNVFDPLPGLYRRTLIALDRRNTVSASMVLVNSDYSRETTYRIYGLFAHVCYLGVDTDLFKPLPIPRENLAVSVGGLNPYKGFDFLVKSLGLVPAPQRPKLVIVSNYADAREQIYLETLANQLNVQVHFRSQISDNELVQWYNRASLTLYAPIMEPFGFVPIEAMACGSPVIGVREGGVRETIHHGETGWLTPRDVTSYAAAVVGLLNNDDYRLRLGKQARQRVVSDWDWQRTVEQLESQFFGLIGSRHRSSRRGVVS